MKTIITAYSNPDLDGVACSYAYAEFLGGRDRESTVAFSGKLQREAFFIADFLKIEFANFDEAVKSDDEIILVDASESDMLSEKVNHDRVVELIDHRKVNSANLFKNAKTQIEMVGSCATLITEKFIKNNIEPSRESTIFLYCAIVSNTINFKASVTTNRDHEAAKFLLGLGGIPKDITHRMFEYKSNIGDPIESIFPENLKSDSIAGKKVSIFQIEIIGVDEFIKNNHEEIVNFLDNVSSENFFDHTFLTCIDIEKGENTFVAPILGTQKMLSDIFSVRFENNVAKYKKIIMRKEIKPLIKEYLEKRSI